MLLNRHRLRVGGACDIPFFDLAERRPDWRLDLDRMDSQPVLLRTAAFLVDALLIGLALVLLGTGVSWATVALERSTSHLDTIWMVIFTFMLIGLVLRDGWHGRSLGKHLLGLRVRTRTGDRCGYARSILRNLPLVIPGWNLVEVFMIFFTADARRSGDRIAGTRVTEE